MASKMTIHARSALPHNQKRNILTQEVIRILKNCSQELPWEIKAKHIEDLSVRMQFSGHNKKPLQYLGTSELLASCSFQISHQCSCRPLSDRNR